MVNEAKEFCTFTVLTEQFLLVLRVFQVNLSLDAALEHSFGPEPYTGSYFSSGNHCCCVVSSL